MSALEELATTRVGSLAVLARETGIELRTLRDIAEGTVQPDRAHVRRIKSVLGRQSVTLMGHSRPVVEFLPVTEARVLDVRSEHLVRPHNVRKDDMIRLVEDRDVGGERFVGWVKVKSDAKWVRGDLVAFTLKDDTVVECHPAQVVTVARRVKEETA